MTRIGPRRVHLVRGRGGNIKFRALKLEQGNFSWGTETVTRKTRILVVVYNSSNNELVRTNTLVKNAIVQVDATPFRTWYEQHYGIPLGKGKSTSTRTAAGADKTAKPAAGAAKTTKPTAATPAEGDKAAPAAGAADKQAAKPAAVTTKSPSLKHKLAKRRSTHPPVEAAILEQFASGRLYASISSRPGQSGRADGYILEGDELAFYLKKMAKK